ETARSLRIVLDDKQTVGYALTLSFTAGVFIAFIGAGPFIIENVHGSTPQMFGALYALGGVVLLASSQLNAHLLRTRRPQRLLATGLVLQIASASSMLVVALTGVLGLAGVAVCFICSFAVWGLVATNAVALGLANHADRAGAASALLGIAQYAS